VERDYSEPFFPCAASRGRELAVIMAKLDVNQKWLFEKTGISKGQLSRICSGGTMRKRFAVAIASVLIEEHRRQFGERVPPPTVESIFEITERPGQRAA
jgi:hypothetical protein